jgi:hypothetical protein
VALDEEPLRALPAAAAWGWLDAAQDPRAAESLAVEPDLEVALPIPGA